jgi:hypothetical protein
MLPAFPVPDVATDIVPPSAIVNVGTGASAGAVTVIWPALPVPDAVLNNPLPAPEIETNSPAVTATVPPAPSLVVLLRTCAPLVCVRVLTLSEMLPALPAPSVATEIVPPFMAKVGVETVISPAFPVLEAVLNSPLPTPEKEADSVAVTVTLPPWPEPLVLLTTCAPPVCVKLLTFSETLPAFPAPDVATEIVPPSPIVNVGVETVTSPAFPVLDVVLNSPLPAPDIETNSLAVAPTVPPAPLPVVLLKTCAPLVRLRLFTLSEILPAAPAP